MQVTDEHFAEANGQSEAVGDGSEKADPNATGKATRKTTRAVAEPTRMDGKSDAPQMEKPLQNRGFSEKRMAVVGIEPTTHGL